jgi:L-2-hydroxyglutarate oxidase LhgO
MASVECIVAGAGVVGLAVARTLALAGHEVLVLERAGRSGTGTSARNSEVIHAGIYYPPGSRMARFCMAGRRALYAYCETRQVRFERCGKLIVANSPEEEATLGRLAERAAQNSINDVRMLSGEEARALEPEVLCKAALYSPSTGILDVQGLMAALQADAVAAGARFAFLAEVESVRARPEGFEVATAGPNPSTYRCRTLINSAGIDAPGLAARIDGLAPRHVPQAYYAKGTYFRLAGPAPFERLVYPVPVPGALGIHFTLDLAHRARFGPDIEWVEAVDYTVDPARAEAFYAAIRRYWPALADGALEPAYSGIRPKIAPAGAPAQDFLIEGPENHGVPGLVNLFGIESPGLTSCLAIADYVAGIMADQVRESLNLVSYGAVSSNLISDHHRTSASTKVTLLRNGLRIADTNLPASEGRSRLRSSPERDHHSPSYSG